MAAEIQKKMIVEGVKKGIEQGQTLGDQVDILKMHEVILKVLRSRFSPIPEDVPEKIQAITSRDYLDHLFDSALEAETFADIDWHTPNDVETERKALQTLLHVSADRTVKRLKMEPGSRAELMFRIGHEIGFTKSTRHGEVKAFQSGILKILYARFRTLPESTVKKVFAITSLLLLEELLDSAIRIENIDDLS